MQPISRSAAVNCLLRAQDDDDDIDENEDEDEERDDEDEEEEGADEEEGTWRVNRFAVAGRLDFVRLKSL